MRSAGSAEDLLKTVVEIVGTGRRARHVRVLVGDGSGTRRADLESRFSDVAVGTCAEGAVLECVAEPLAARCARCGEEFSGSGLSCPRCGGAELVFIGGTSTAVLSVDIDG